MELIINFYKELDTLNLIIFWGIIIVIILLLILSFVLINKNKKLKKIVEENNKYEEEIPIKNKEIEIKQNIEENHELESELIMTVSEEKNAKSPEEIVSPPIEVENNFVVEEHISEYNRNIINQEESQNENSVYQVNTKQVFEIPNKPYQRNVLREMSLSQTSPIGINRQVPKEDKKTEMVKDLEDSLKNEEINIYENKDAEKEISYTEEINNQVENELTDIEEISYRKTEIQQDVIVEKNTSILDSQKLTQSKDNEELSENQTIELLNNQEPVNDEINKTSEKYLEEVSKKLAEAEIPNDIERTNYELQQEEDAIISYKELMEKKDSIQTIDEEEAIISIEELMNRTNNKSSEQIEETKLYNLGEEEANDNFIKELKQFRNDL